ncbi:MAG: oligosaccharide flippase family protein [Bacteroidales bacterium]|nr:oligosaccharide flippase family protein [Bacteroidales bacterium]
MGIIIKQSIKGTIYAYLGVVIGFLNVVVIMPKILLAEEIGLVNMLVALSNVFAQFASLGYNNVTVRLFSYFRDKKNDHHGFLGITMVITLIGFLLSAVVFFILKPYLEGSNQEDSPLFVENIYWLLPLIFFTLYYTIFDNFLKVLYNSTAGTLYKEVIFRILVLADLILFQFKLIDFDFFLAVYCVGMAVPMLLMIIDLFRQNELNWSWPGKFITPELRKQMMKVAIYGFIGGSGTILTSNIDKYLVGNLIDLEATGIYSIAFFIGTLILKPSLSILKISSTVLADAWKNNDRKTIAKIYSASCRDMLIVALFIFLGIWINRNNIFSFLPEAYASGRYVVLFVGLGSLIEMASGTGGMVIQTSRHFPVITYARLLTGVILILLNFLLIPQYQILGAAMALFFSRIFLSGLKIMVLWIKFGLPAFDLSTIKGLAVSGISWGLAELIPQLGNLYLDLILRSGLFAIAFGTLIYQLKISPPIQDIINQTLVILKIRKRG